ncbi:MAG: hypothetical protein IJV30_04780 [Oscillospiraceae bacterium]|nr:hypothetical protein [Oscillospiraceae bacterium]
MADFNYAELCLAMDHLYGLKDIHHIDSFDALLYQLGLREMMKSTSAADAAVFVISAVLGDGSVSALNPMTGAMATAVYNVDLNLDHQYGQYDIDQGSVPDFTISKYMSFYDRERLTEYIDSLL